MGFAQALLEHTALRNGLLWLVEPRHPKPRIWDSLRNHAYALETSAGGVASNNTYATAFPRGPASRFDAAGDGSYTIEGRKPTIETATLAMWIKCANATPSVGSKTGFPINYSYQSGTASASHYTWTDGVIYCNTLRSDRRSITPSSSVNRADWHLVTVTTSPSGWQFYQNGYLVDSTTSTAVGTLQTAFFGKSSDVFTATSYYFNGDIAWWGFWTTRFTLANVLELLRFSRSNQDPFEFPYHLAAEAVVSSTFQAAWITQRSRLLTGGQV